MDEEFKNFFFNKEYLESIYNVLKGEEKELKREVLKSYIENVFIMSMYLCPIVLENHFIITSLIKI
jgi:hypothetical protein